MGVTSWATCLLREEVARSSSHFSFFSTESFTYSLTEAPPPINSTLITTISSLWKAYIYTTIEHEDIQQIVPKYENAKTTTQSGKQWNKLNNIPLYFFTCVRVIISWFINPKHEINERRTKISSTGVISILLQMTNMSTECFTTARRIFHSFSVSALWEGR